MPPTDTDTTDDVIGDDELDQLFEEDHRDELIDDAVDAVNLALQREPIPGHPDEPEELIEEATNDLGVELPTTRSAAIGAVETVIQRRRGH